LKYYKNIEDLPIKLWFDIHETGNYNLLLISKTKVTDKVYNTLHKCWESIYEQYIKEFGLSDDYLAHINIKKKIANLQADLIITGQKHFKTLIKIEREKIKINSLGEKKPASLNMNLAKMSKYYGFHLNSKELTVIDYYSYVNNIVNG